MFTVSLSNLSRDARKAIEDWGTVNLGSLSAAELSGLLDGFVEIDEVENVKADPEIRVQARRERLIIRTGQKKLFVQNAGNLAEPSYVLTVGEILAELDGSAAARRTVPPVAGRNHFSLDRPAPDEDAAGEAKARPTPVRGARPRVFALLGLVGVFAAYSAHSQWANPPGGDPPGLTPLTTVERLAEESALTGVYTTGSEPGQHGIVLLGDGKLKLFQTNAQAAPAVIFGAYRLGRIDGNLCLATDQPGGLIKVRGRESLEFCGKIYKRLP